MPGAPAAFQGKRGEKPALTQIANRGYPKPMKAAAARSGLISPTSSEDRLRLFERFTQGQSKRREGVGLGLAIARELVMQRRGELWVDSELGHGSTFSFTLPWSTP